ncbi:MAG: flagellar hook-associated protein FlgK [Alicyclobacillus sp.]|nr:flagellar hook-associated protein FlgK [Alicyclobacillus sp.]
MLGTFLGLEIAKRGLQTAQAAIEVTAHNVSNANTPGYTRQRLDLTASPALEVPGLVSAAPGQIGTGVQITQIQRLRDSYLDSQYRQQNGTLGSWQAQQDTLQKVTAIINEPSDTGLSTVMQNFWNAWDQLAVNPNDLSARNVVAQSAVTVAQTISQMADQLNSLQSDLSTSVQDNVDQVNSYLSQIAQLNQQIESVEGDGKQPNDLLDQRDYLVDQLSNLADVTVTDAGSSYQISIGGTVVLDNATVMLDPTTSQPLLQVQSDGTLTLPVSSGQLQGLEQSVATVQSYQADLEAFATTLANSVNGLLTTGFTQNGSPGVAMFAIGSGSSPLISVNSAITSDVSNIAAGFSTAAGDGTLAAAISALKTSQLTFTAPSNSSATMPLSQGTLDGFLQAVVGQLGIQGQQANEQVTNQQALVQQVDTLRQSVSSVSIDEEMSNMIQFQQAYNASAKMVSTINEMLTTLMQNV